MKSCCALGQLSTKSKPLPCVDINLSLHAVCCLSTSYGVSPQELWGKKSDFHHCSLPTQSAWKMTPAQCNGSDVLLLCTSQGKVLPMQSQQGCEQSPQHCLKSRTNCAKPKLSTSHPSTKTIKNHAEFNMPSFSCAQILGQQFVINACRSQRNEGECCLSHHLQVSHVALQTHNKHNRLMRTRTVYVQG